MAMSANAVLMKFFKLPPAVRMMLALMGFGSLAAILFRFVPGLRSGKGMIIMLIIFGVGIVLFLVWWGVRKLFAGKKAGKLSKDLESQGPTRGDVAEQEQIYREKFRGKLAELKQNGLSVYKMPWFVLMGEPGCGKTASLIHSGLDFPLGKDEVAGFGGTRNYNWWFTNESVILDTAGRIAFQEEGTTDKLEWEYFLKLLLKNRPRCPINGVIVAVPADKLLRDSAEERQQKATILRERLRQIHQLLGIRFPTFFLITKMDLVGGFGEFFEEIRVDLQQRNQMFGWSRPGEFQESYDPGEFPDAFDEVYLRIRDWGMRYLQRKATDEELGMIVTFPEAFRQLRDPLNDYVATVFQKSPLLEPPFFRGFYFTSAVQEGAPIFDVFARTQSGSAVAERPTKAVDSKAFFIHDLYQHKVFAEQGLVFRSAKHVTLNKRMRRFVWIGSGTMALFMLVFSIIGLFGVRDLIINPRDDCNTAAEVIAQVDQRGATYGDLGNNLELAKRLAAHVKNYDRNWAGLSAKMLYIGASISVPRTHVETIHARYVLDCILRPIVYEVGARLESTQIAALDVAKRKSYLAALNVYTRWYGEMVGQHNLEPMAAHEVQQRCEELRTLMAVIDQGELDREESITQVGLALDSLARETRSFPREILVRSLHLDKDAMTATIGKAVAQLADYWEPYTNVRADNTDSRLNYWIGFIDVFATLQSRYDKLLGMESNFRNVGEAGVAGQEVEAAFKAASLEFNEITKDLQELGNVSYPADDGTFVKAYNDVVKFLANERVPQLDKQILRLAKIKELLAELWNGEFGAIEVELAKGAPNTSADPQAAVYNALREGRERLERLLDYNLSEVRKALGLSDDLDPLDYYVKQKMIVVVEAKPGVPLSDKEATVRISRNPLGPDDLLKGYLQDMHELSLGNEKIEQQLGNLNEWPSLLAAIGAERPPGEVLGPWISAVRGELEGRTRISKAQITDAKVKFSNLREWPLWRAANLHDLGKSIVEASENTNREFLLQQMTRRALATTSAKELPGLARLIPEYLAPELDKLPFDRHRYVPRPAAAQRRPREREADRKPRARDPDDLGRRGRTRKPDPRAAADDEELRGKQKALLVRYHTSSFLSETLGKYLDVRDKLNKIPGGDMVIDALNKAAEAYVDGYFLDWYGVYSDPRKMLDVRTLDLLRQCGDGDFDWPKFHKVVSEDGTQLVAGLALRLESLMQEVVFFDSDLAEGDDRDDKVYELISGRLAILRQKGQAIPYILKNMRNNAPRDRDAAYVFGQSLKVAWNTYVEEVESLGANADLANEPPDLEALRKKIVYKFDPKPENFPLTAPLIDIANHGQELLLYHLDAKLAAYFEKINGSYPVVSDAGDSTPKFGKLSNMKKLEAPDFIALLRHVNAFERKYGKLYETVHRGSVAERTERTIRACQKWVKFLYADPSLLDEQDPRPLEVSLAIVNPRSDEKLEDAGSVYGTFSVRLPLLSLSGGVAPPLVLQTGAGFQQIDLSKPIPDAIAEQKQKYQWNLMSGATRNFEAPSAEVTDLHPDASKVIFPLTATAGWKLDGDPWALLMLIGSQADNDFGDGYWGIPVRIKTNAPNRVIGYQIGVRIGSNARPFPGPVPPPKPPGARPKLKEAAKYLSGATLVDEDRRRGRRSP